MSIIDSLSLAQMKNRKLGCQFWGDDRERLNKGRRGKGIHRMAGLRGNCCKVLMSREIWGNLSNAFWVRPRAVAGDRHKAMVKEGWQVPAGLAQMQHRASQKKAVCLVLLLCEAFNQHLLPGRVRQGSKQYRLFRSHQREIDEENLEEWARSLMGCSYHRDHSRC